MKSQSSVVRKRKKQPHSAKIKKRKMQEQVKSNPKKQKAPLKKKPQKKYPSKRKKVKKRKRIKKNYKIIFLEFLFSIIVVGILLYVVSFFLYTVPKVSGYSMIPTLRDGDRVYVNKVTKLKAFSLVYIQVPGKEKEIKRIIGLPGQQVVYKNDQLKIDGEVTDEAFIFEEQKKSEENGRIFTEDFSVLQLSGKTTIPDKKYLVLGDNRPYSTDSRTYGLIDEKDIIGVVKMRILPLQMMGRF